MPRALSGFLWRGLRLLSAVLLSLAVGACATQAPRRAERHVVPPEALQALQQAAVVELYSLDPEQHGHSGKHYLHGFGVLGRVALEGPAAQRAAAAFVQAVQDSDGYVGMCFEPRHALRVAQAGHIYEFVLCYSCLSMRVYIDGRIVIGVSTGGRSDVLDELLRERGIELARDE